MPAAEIAHRPGIAEQTFYRWKKEYGGLEPGQVRERRLLREENAREKKIVADLSLDKAMLTDIAQINGGRAAATGGGALFTIALRNQRAARLCAGLPVAFSDLVSAQAATAGRAATAYS